MSVVRSILILCVCVSGVAGEDGVRFRPPKGPTPNDALLFIYEAPTGEMTIHAGGDLICRGIMLRSDQDVFVGEMPDELNGDFNVWTRRKVMIFDTLSLPDPLRLPHLLPTGLKFEDVSKLISVSGSITVQGRSQRLEHAYLLIDAGRLAQLPRRQQTPMATR